MESMQTDTESKKTKWTVLVARRQYQLEFCKEGREENQKIIWRNTGKIFFKFDENYESTYSRCLTAPKQEKQRKHNILQ